MRKINWNGIKRSLKNFGKTLNKHSPELLTAAGIAGGVTTVVLVAKEAPIVKEKLDELHVELAERDEELTKAQILWEETKVAVPVYAPAIITGAASVACLTGSCNISTKRTAALATAYEITATNFNEYKKKAKEVLGETKTEKLEAAIAKDKVEKNPPKSNEVILDGDECLFYDSLSGRYFKSTADKVRRAENKLNKQLRQEMWISLNDLYYELGIPSSKLGDEMGWNIDEEIDIYFNSIVAPGDVPCLVMEFMCKPRFDYRNLH